MARKKDMILQEALSNQEEWGIFVSKPGLTVIDCFQSWCGPCKPVVGLLRRLKIEISSELLHFAKAECDSIDSLEHYRGNCEPCFHFYGGGQMVAVVRGCDAPVIERTIRQQVKLEEGIAVGEGERVVIKDPALVDDSDAAGDGDGTDGPDGVNHITKLVTVAVIKPDLTSNAEKMEDILEKIEQNGLEIVADEEKVLSVEDVTALYSAKVGTPEFDDILSFMTSGPVRALGLTKGDTGEGVVELWRDIIGPFDPEEAKVKKPDSIRARYGSTAVSNAVHGACSREDAARELGFFFPTFSPPRAVIPQSVKALIAEDGNEEDVFPEKKMERTITLIRPEALKLHREAIMGEIKEAGFEIVREKEITLTAENVALLYEEHKEKDFYEDLVTDMTSGPCLVLCLAKENAIAAWREKLGPATNAEEEEPESMRARFPSGHFNAIHAATSPEDFQREKSIFFGDERAIALIKPDGIEKSADIMEQLKSVGFEIQEVRDIELSRDVASKIYAGKEGEEFFDDLVNHMTEGTCKVLVMSDIDAISKLREQVGPFDPEEAKQTAADSIRAKFAESLIHNAIHAPTSAEDTELHFSLLLGD